MHTMDKHLTYLDVGSGFPLLLGHSYLFDRHMWTPQLVALAKHYRVIVPDLWGHGDSPALPASHSSLSDIANDHLNLMDRLGIKEFGVIGLSVGGMWGAELAAIAPERVKLLALMDSYLGDETEEARQRYFGMLAAVEQAGVIASPILEYVAAQFYSDNAPDSLMQPLIAHLETIPAQTLRDSVVPLGKMIFGRPDKLALLEKITAAAIVITGEQDKPRPPAEGERMAQILGCSHVLIPHAGHISNKENPQAVTETLLAFLAESLPPR
ncbi:3-oxoadipate enol-lactonase 2 [Serratia entomophila]|nr:3-oxoadipate enol-lactonase 2 [Serratia entomophila]CAI2927472.1 3-oxoadipate enol-lactonase 2 [Serratia entomophila]